jgi:queuine tRNA-ribosyltransferase subunit QTRTD1
MFSPAECIALVLDGRVDAVESGHPVLMTERGRACATPLRSDSGFNPDLAAVSTVAGGSLNLWDRAFRTDTRPLVEGCTCYACERHSRAYIHHLLRTHEMLAMVLLYAHNLHRFAGMFEELRSAIADGETEELRQRFGA